MLYALLAAAVLAAPAAATAPSACRTDDMRADWQSKTFALWLTDYTIPDSAPRTATLRFRDCVVADRTLGEPMTPQEQRTFVSEDGTIGVIATTDETDPAATWLTLVTKNGNNGLTNSAQLGSFAHIRVYYRGVGFDRVHIQDWRQGGKTVVTNVFVIPEDAVVKH